MDYEYDAEVVRVVDGDTVYLKVSKTIESDFGFHVKEMSTKSYVGSFRLAGIDTPESRGRKAQPIPARAATLRLTELLSSAHNITARTLKDPDNFGRYLVELIVHVIDVDSGEILKINVNETLIKEGHAVVYKR